VKQVLKWLRPRANRGTQARPQARQSFWRSSAPSRGFTLLELLVALVMASLVVTALLSFVVSITNTEKRELAKSTSQQEMQNAIDYMVRDVQEAVYIYDNTSLSLIRGRIPPNANAIAGCGNSGNPTNCEPILVFWKRRALDRCDELGGQRVGLVTGRELAPAPTNCLNGNDTFVYSLVVYYLIRDVNPGQNPTWSNTARVGRFEIRDGVPDPTKTSSDLTRFDTGIQPDNGFQPFSLPDITPATTQDEIVRTLGEWKSTLDVTYPRAGQPYPNNLQILVDFIDDTSLTAPAPSNVIANTLPIDPNPTTGRAECRNPNIGAMGPNAERIPADFSTLPGTLQNLSSFFVCVNPIETTARIYLRGNALARINRNANQRIVTGDNLGFLPTVEATAFGGGFFIEER